MRYSHADNAVSPVIAARALGGGAVQVQDGSRFAAGSPSVEEPMRLSIFVGPDGEEVLKTVLRCTGVAGGALAVSGTLDGYADYAVSAADVDAGLVKAACVPHRGDLDAIDDRLDDLQAQLDAIELTPGPKGDKGDDGLDGEDGAPGTPGTVLRSGEGPPDDSLGVDGDYYLDLSTGDLYRRVAATYGVVGNLQGPPGDPGEGGGGGDFVDLTSDQDVAGAKTFESLSAERLAILNTVGAVACESDTAGNFHPFTERFRLALNVDLSVGNTLGGSIELQFPGVIAGVSVRAEINGAAGGFTVRAKNDAATVGTQAVASSNTATVPFGSISNTTFAKGAKLSVDVTAAGTGVQNVWIDVYGLRRHQ